MPRLHFSTGLSTPVQSWHDPHKYASLPAGQRKRTKQHRQDTAPLNRLKERKPETTAFRTRLYNVVVAEAETEAWQKLIRVLTHEIMNSIAIVDVGNQMLHLLKHFPLILIKGKSSSQQDYKTHDSRDSFGWPHAET